VEITEVRIKLMDDLSDRLRAFCSITIDSSFVIRDLKIIQGGKGPFVAMPSRKLTDKCPKCHAKNNLRAAFCNECGCRLKPDRALKGADGRAKLYADVAHPIHSACRDMIQECVIRAYEDEQVLAQQPGYVCRYDDYDEDSFAQSLEFDWETPAADSSRGSTALSESPSQRKPVSQCAGGDPPGTWADRSVSRTGTDVASPVAPPESVRPDEIRRLDAPEGRELRAPHVPARGAVPESADARRQNVQADAFGEGII
jgi:stage V sporulation protein G